MDKTDTPYNIDFRDKYCKWCKHRKAPISQCRLCPRYIRFMDKGTVRLDPEALCRACIHNNEAAMQVFCETNRFFQKASDEPFECYQFCMKDMG
ncbi:MAG: hypothetical protein U9P80_04025 [Thermodesulfobacteriota bacterium]|nr:hypothetical protein [Thermodesulfobacteriota bacterium]